MCLLRNIIGCNVFMRNTHYGIVDNEGGGDCLFAVIRDALRGTDKETSVRELRAILAQNATEDVFKGFKEHYDMYRSAIHTSRSNMLISRGKISSLKKSCAKGG